MKEPVDRGGDRTILMTVHEVAQYLRLSEAKVYRMTQAGAIPAIRIGRAWRFKRELIDEWIRRESERRQMPETVGAGLVNSER